MSTTHRNSLVGGAVPPQATTVNERDISSRGRMSTGSYMKSTISSGRRSRSNSGDANDTASVGSQDETRIRVPPSTIRTRSLSDATLGQGGGRSLSVDRGTIAQNKQIQSKLSQRFKPAGQSSYLLSGISGEDAQVQKRGRFTDPTQVPVVPRRLSGQPTSNKQGEMIPPHQFNEGTQGHAQVLAGRAYDTDDHTKSILSQRSVGPQSSDGPEMEPPVLGTHRNTPDKIAHESTDCRNAAEREQVHAEGRVSTAEFEKGTSSVPTPLTSDNGGHPPVLNDGQRRMELRHTERKSDTTSG